MNIGGVNLLAVIIASLTSMIIGMVWFSPILFGNLWMRLSKLGKTDVKKLKAHGLSKTYVASFVSTSITAYVLGLFMRFSGVTDLVGGLAIGIMLWLGFVSTTLLGGVLWDRKPVQLYLLNNSYQLVSYIVMSLILVLWG